MFFSVQDLELRKIHYDVDFPAGEIDFADPGAKQAGVLKANGVVELLSNTLGEIRIHGHVKVDLDALCDRCLEPAPIRIDSDLDLFYRPADSVPAADEVEIDAGESEIGFYEGHGILLEDVLREFVLLAMPMQNLCRPDCQGICPVCGQNKNQAACSCPVQAADDRWAALKNL